MSVRFWLSLVVSSVLSASVLADEPAVPAQAPASAKIPAQAPAAPLAVTCEFVEISATKAKTASIDPQLGPIIEKKLKKAPLSTQWNEFKQLSRATRKLAQKKTEAIELKQGSATATLVEIVDKSKVRLTITIDNAKGKQAVNQTTLLDAGDYVIHAVVLPPNDDGHLVAVTCK